ncbi:MAG: ATP-binding protein [Nanoarchaeota archaeon]|nr:ATP-binding protein [Nanoarchaeota archaeon]
MKEILTNYNPWWTTNKIDKSKIGLIREHYLNKLLKFISSREILKIMGIRRCGKTTLMYQTINYLLTEKKIDPKKILYVQLDDSGLSLHNKETIIKDILDNYQELVGCNLKKENIFVFFDEVQYIENWDSWIKTYYDSTNLKFVLSGSSTLLIEKTSVEKLTGRQLDFLIYPFSFREYLSINKVHLKLKSSMDQSNMNEIEINADVLSKKDEIKINLINYINSGGFPEVVSLKEDLRKIKLRQYFNDIIYRDIIKVFNLRNANTIEELAVYFMKHIGKQFNYAGLSNIFKVSTDTIIEYTDFLKKSFLFDIVTFYSDSLKSTIRKDRKIYCIDSGLPGSIILQIDEGHIIENIVYSNLKRKFKNIYYWKDRYEVDFIVRTPDMILPIEVKYRNTTFNVSGLEQFIRKKNLDYGIVITKDRSDVEEHEGFRIRYIPLWQFLLMF